MKPHWILLLLFSLIAATTQADDTEIYLGSPNSNTVKPNVVFIFDTSGSMETGLDGRRPPRSGEKRLDVTKRAAINTINNLSGVNLSLMQFNIHNNDHGGFVEVPMKSIDNPNHKQDIINKINTFGHTTWTPMVESVHEAYLYLTGGDVKYGNKRVCEWEYYEAYNGALYKDRWGNWQWSDRNNRGTHNRRQKCYDKVVSHPDSYRADDDDDTNAKYKSPITDSCQKNHIVLFTDGASTYDGGSDSDIMQLMQSAGFSAKDLAGTGISNTCDTNNSSSEDSEVSSSCLKNLAYTMYNSDATPNIDGIQSIQFHAIGGFIGGSYQKTLDQAAALGGGISANAQNYEELESALKSLFDNIVQSGGTFAAPAVSVNAFNSLEQLDQMYYSVFKPHESVGWSGNVKRFRMANNQIVDVNGKSAIDADSGFFSSEAQSFWTPDELSPDGDNVTRGGMASRLESYLNNKDRIVISNLTANPLMAVSNRISDSNSLITKALMGTHLTDASFGGYDIDPSVDPDLDQGSNDAYTTNEFTKLLQWVGGIDSKLDASQTRKSMEDPLHSTPVLLNYGSVSINGETVPDSTLFIGTNSGYLHAFDTHAEKPLERFAFIPKELLPVATKYYEKKGQKKYGLDGHISVWHDDTNKDMIINNSEEAYLYIGMRRGGSSYYALDVSNRNQPKLLWQINGRNHQNGPFENLGQTWSKMLPIDIKWNGVKKKALIFSGGYDIAEDNNLRRTDHSVGNAIYMVDAKTGALLWKAGKSGAHLNIPEMKSAIVGDVVAIDDNSDGYVDLLYVADLGGRVFRIDFDQSETSASAYATGGMIADLGNNSGQSEHVRFYNTLDVVYSKAFSYVESTDTGTNMVNGKPRYVLSIGSGYRAHPLDNRATDHFYVLFDYNTEGPALGSDGKPTYSSITRSQLQKFTLTGSSKAITPSLETNNGFYVELINAGSSKGGEKVLSDSLTLDNTIYFTTFRPSTGTMSSSCAADTGQSRLYKLSLKPGVSSLAVEDLNIPGIAPKPVVIMPKAPKDGDDEVDTSPKLLISTQIVDTENSEYPLKKTYWRELKQ